MIELIDPESEKVVLLTSKNAQRDFTIYHFPATDEFQMETIIHHPDGWTSNEYTELLTRDEFTMVVRLFLEKS